MNPGEGRDERTASDESAARDNAEQREEGRPCIKPQARTNETKARKKHLLPSIFWKESPCLGEEHYYSVFISCLGLLPKHRKANPCGVRALPPLQRCSRLALLLSFLCQPQALSTSSYPLESVFHVDGAVAEVLPIHGVNGSICCLKGRIVDKRKTFAGTRFRIYIALRIAAVVSVKNQGKSVESTRHATW